MIRATTLLAVILLLPACSFMGLSPEDKSKVVDEALKPGKTSWCLDLAIITPMCLYKNKGPQES